MFFMERKRGWYMKKIKKHFFLVLFIAVNIMFVFLLIYKQSLSTHLFYKQQLLDKEIEKLTTQKQELTHALYEQKNKNNILDYATTNLGMQKVTLKQIKKLNHDKQ